MKMNLTPIHIRGRRKRPPPDERQIHPPIKRTSGRPRLTPQALLHSSQQSQSARRRAGQDQSQQHGRKRKKLHYHSHLESLPVELLERIFLYALNLQLPRASPALGAALSREGVYRALILRAFWDDHYDGNDGEGVEGTGAWMSISRMFRPMDAPPVLSYEERSALQVGVLRCRWCTVPRVMAQVPALTSLVVLRRWVGAGVRMEKAQEEELERAMAGVSGRTVFEGYIPAAVDSHGGNTAETEGSATHYTMTITPKVSIRIDCPETASQTLHHPTHPIPRTPPPRQQPHALLPNPTQPNPQKPITLSRTALQEGIHAAITQRNHPLLLTLLKLDEHHHRTSTPGPYTLPPSHFHTAANLHPADPTTFQLLLRTSAESLPADDSAITQWAMHQGGPLGRWVLDLMTAMPQLADAALANPARDAVFYMGRANEGVELARRYVREVVGVEGLENWMGEGEVDL
ncbi:hypothetical protein P168DRAFT_325590 [Aspergillus campestris IBT 28561]|uniref:F-box domain-containing protein n=1 Tax=Aspergillus campestris (strain IBT 28561) TaxID=1392248 RepID=A0A2I1DA62_ASPC2|nr:uncharacterized protein P168DRAFT_325590 [Aspergillus campestris IBT 28561]PKY06767.1 hypothetical protein P168DRAFT_325590 [Aspergillus campestris IBT 28561]